MAIQFLCPTCGESYTLRDELAGRKARCRKCRNTLFVPTVTDDNEPSTAAAESQTPASNPFELIEDGAVSSASHEVTKSDRSPESMFPSFGTIDEAVPGGSRRVSERRGRWIPAAGIGGGALIALVVVVYVAWRSYPKTDRERDERWGDATVHVENNTNKRCRILIDGEPRTTVAGNSTASFKLRSGTRQIGYDQDGTPLQEESREIRRAEGDSKPPKYLMIIRAQGEYGAYTAKYRGGITPQMPVFITSESQANSNYQSAVKELPERLELREWNDISPFDDVLSKPPKRVQLRSDNQFAAYGSRRVLVRLSADEWEFIESTREKAGRDGGRLSSDWEAEIRRIEEFMKKLSGLE